MSLSANPSESSPARNYFPDGPRLLADIGVTNARFALEVAPGRFAQIKVLPCGEYAGFPEVLRAYLALIDSAMPRHAAVAIANPIQGDVVQMTNRAWKFSIEEVRQNLGLDTLLLVNDFTALAHSLPFLAAHQRRQIGGSKPAAGGVIGLIGSGSGLGVSGLIPEDSGWVTLGSEGGHAGFTPADERELFVLQYAWQEYEHVSVERLVSNSGIELVYRALCQRQKKPPRWQQAQDIMQQALKGRDRICVEAMECFCGMLGTFAGNVALTLGAVGGIFVGGGIVPRLGEFFDHSSFRERFERKGRFSDYLRQIPTYVITAKHPAFLGVSAILSEQLKASDAGAPLLEHIREAETELSPAEKRVAKLILEKPRAVLTYPIADIARHASVSQPTVIRFCRSLGYQGLADFKLKLASGLTGTVPVQHSQVKVVDALPDLSAKVLNNTITAISKLRDSINMEAVDKAIEVLRQARHIELYGLGNSSVVALDGQHKFYRVRIPSVAPADPNTQALSASLLRQDDVVIAISSSGRPADLLNAVDIALESGAQVIAITARKSPLAKKASIALTVDHDEDSTTHISMISRILHLLMIDVLAVGLVISQHDSLQKIVKRRRGNKAAGDDGAESMLASLISHIK